MKFLKSELEADHISGMSWNQWQEYDSDPVMKAKLYEDLRAHNADGQLAIRMGSNICKVLRKEVDPLQLMFGQDELLDQVYEQVVKLGDLPVLQKIYLGIVRHNSTNLNILEVGAGTGSSTAAMLDGLDMAQNDGQPRQSCISKYTFTDVSAGFFEKAKEKFKNYRHIMEFKTLNAEKDIITQGFEAGSYDFVVAGNVIHATANLRKTLSIIQKLLKPGGKLILQEGIRQDFLWSGLSFGQLPGWWLGVESIREWSPWITAPQWDTILKDSGFSGVDLNLRDRQNESLHTQSLIISTAVAENQEARNSVSKTYIISTFREPTELALELQNYLSSNLSVRNCFIIDYNELNTTELSSAVCISLMEVERPVLETLQQVEYENIQKLLATCGALLWITGDILEQPELNMISGLIRTVRWERDIDAANLITLSISSPAPPTSEIIQFISKLYVQQFVSHLLENKINGEFMLQNGQFLSGRLVSSDDANTYLASKFSRPTPVIQRLGDAGRPVKLATSSPGLLNKLEFITDPIYNEPLTETQVEIKIKAVGLNFRDLMIAMGEHMAYSLGNEAAGIVSRVGTQVTEFEPGDKVVYMCGLESTGCFHTYGRVDQNVVVHIPENISYEIAASLPCVYSTVIYGLADAARLQRGEKILIHAAAGGVGQAAINFAKHVGAEIYATVSTTEKRDLLINEYGISEENIFSSRDLTFVQGIMRVTNNKGIDVVLNSLAGEALRRSWDLLAPFGRFVEIGKKDAQANGKIELHPFLRNVTMTSVELPTMMRHRPSLIKRLTEDTMSLYAKGAIKEALPTKVMTFEQIEEGLRTLQSGKGVGKMVFVPNPDDMVPVVPAQLEPYKFSPDASYVLAGGLGGLGRSLARWMVSRGAEHLVFLSRSGNITEPVKEMQLELESKGCKIYIFTCDISDKERLTTVLRQCKNTLPPIRGCIQGSMILQDKMFENMLHETFQAAIRPKVRGSKNLHELLPNNMDFFVLLSSATGILGNRSQANYAAGNTYQDALARHRVSKGLPAATIDLGTVLSVGYVAENRDKTTMTKHLGTVLEVLREEEIHVLMEYIMDPRSKLDGTSCQLVSGLTDATMYHQRGIPMPTYLSYPLFTQLRNQSTSGDLSSGEDSAFLTQALLSTATTLTEATDIVGNALRFKLSSLLSIPIDNIDPAKSVSSNGVDSLVAMEFRTYLAKNIGADIPLLDIMGTDSIQTLSGKIAGLSKMVQISSSSVGVATV
ncbi:beta-ketoacyl synthase domain-containing protein [Phlyctema vagabunda]|uniref:Beta-ketoacyl synthase domain-containing protein n=1 Tax=Phlyctema vagabunda TaxID=108571 RepID=A0ABR4PTA5_9HELO